MDKKLTFKEIIEQSEPDEIDRAKQIVQTVVSSLKDNPLFKEFTELEPFILKEIEKDDYKGLSFEELLLCEYKDENNNLLENGLFMRAYNNALQEYNNQIIKITYKSPIDNIDYPIDKINNNLWNELAIADKNGQLTFTFDTLTKKLDKPTTLLSISFAELENNDNVIFSKTLEPYEKRIYIIVGSIWSSGKKAFTVKMVYELLGGKGNPDQSSIEKITKAIDKMRYARLYINNQYEVQNSNYPLFNITGAYDGYLLPIEKRPIRINGELVTDAYIFLREPPLVEYAKIHKQITTFKREIICFPLNNNNNNIIIEDYLIERIAGMKSDNKKSKKILFSTLLKETKNTTYKQKSRAIDKVIVCLDHLKAHHYIKDYSKDTDSITISP